MISENVGIQQQGKIVCMDGVMVSLVVSSAVELSTTFGQVIAETMKLIFVASPLSMQYQGVRVKIGSLNFRTMCSSGATCVPLDCCL